MLRVIGLAIALHNAAAFYLPGVIPETYSDGEEVELKVS